MTTPTGEIILTGRGSVLRFARVYGFPPDEVWSAVTEPDRAKRWLGELIVTGETGRLMLGDTDDEAARLRILACDRPYRIEVEWTFPGAAPTHVLVTLAADGPGRTALVLEHTFPGQEPTVLPGYACGWEHYLDALDAYLAGAALPLWSDYYPARLDGWLALVPSGG
jgi:uncharacterized protein YndB with AHSA1/START domain